MAAQDESELGILGLDPLDLIFQHTVFVTERGIELAETPHINPASLPQLLKEALPYGQMTELELTRLMSLTITVESVPEDLYNSSLPRANSGLDKTDMGQVTELYVSIVLGGSNEPQDSLDDPYLNPRSLFANHPSGLDLDTVTANFFLAGSLRLQAERIKTGFTPQLGTVEMYTFAKEHTARMLAGESQPIILLNAQRGR